MMRKTFFLLSAFIMMGCSSHEFDALEPTRADAVQSSFESKPHARSLRDAVAEANKVLEKELAVQDYVLTYAICNNDTVAYVLNRGLDEGFAVVSCDDRVDAILAFNTTCNFSYKAEEEDIVYSEFICRLPGYIKASIEEAENPEAKEETRAGRLSLPGQFPGGFHVKNPVIRRTWHQRDPYDKYVIEDHPGCPTGCVPVATGMIMAHCKDTLVYHNHTFPFDKIRKALADSIVVTGPSFPNLLPPVTFPFLNTWANGTDWAAKLLYYLGIDQNINYTTGGSGTTTSYILPPLYNCGYNVMTNGFVNFSSANMVTALDYIFNQNCLLLVCGVTSQGVTSPVGHAWVAEGCRYLFATEIYQQPNSIMFYFNWGWQGRRGNGFYNAGVFAPTGTSYNFNQSPQFAAIKIEADLSNN